MGNCKKAQQEHFGKVKQEQEQDSEQVHPGDIKAEPKLDVHNEVQPFLEVRPAEGIQNNLVHRHRPEPLQAGPEHAGEHLRGGAQVDDLSTQYGEAGAPVRDEHRNRPEPPQASVPHHAGGPLREDVQIENSRTQPTSRPDPPHAGSGQASGHLRGDWLGEGDLLNEELAEVTTAIEELLEVRHPDEEQIHMLHVLLGREEALGGLGG